jgi:hypothetical protein
VGSNEQLELNLSNVKNQLTSSNSSMVMNISINRGTQLSLANGMLSREIRFTCDESSCDTKLGCTTFFTHCLACGLTTPRK